VLSVAGLSGNKARFTVGYIPVSLLDILLSRFTVGQFLGNSPCGNTSGNNPHPRGNKERKLKKPATESTCAQG